MKTDFDTLAQTLKQAKEAYPPIIEQSWLAFSQALAGNNGVTQQDIAGAARQAHRVLHKFVVDDASEPCNDQQHAVLELNFNQLMPTFNSGISIAQIAYDHNQLAITAAIGALVGMLLLGTMGKMLLNSGPSGVFIGALVGAYAGVKWIGRLKAFNWMQWLNQFKANKQFNVERYKKQFVVAAQHWLDQASLLYAVLQAQLSPALNDKQQDRQRALADIGNYLIRLHHANKKDLSIIAQELLQAAEHHGFADLEGAPHFISETPSVTDTFVWNDEAAKKYKSYGQISNGTTVRVIKRPVIRHGDILERGVVRKLTRAHHG